MAFFVETLCVIVVLFTLISVKAGNNNKRWQLQCIATWRPRDGVPVVLFCFGRNRAYTRPIRMHRNCYVSGQNIISLLNSATPIYMVRIFWRSMDIYSVTLTFDTLTLCYYHRFNARQFLLLTVVCRCYELRTGLWRFFVETLCVIVVLFTSISVKAGNNNKRWQLQCIATWRPRDGVPVVLFCFGRNRAYVL